MNLKKLIFQMGATEGGVVTYSISGAVFDADGVTPVEGVTVALGAETAQTAANGTYTISDLPAGASGSLTATKAGYSFPAITIAAMTGNLANQNYSNAWWAAGGTAALCVAAYRGLGAATAAASYVNLANPGTYDLTTTSAPGFGHATGWAFDGSGAQFLDTGFQIGANAWTTVVRGNTTGSGANGSGRMLAGYNDAYFILNNGTTVQYKNGGTTKSITTPTLGDHVFIMANALAYMDGAQLASDVALAALGAGNVILGNNAALNREYQGGLYAAAFYSSTLTAPQIAAVNAAITALDDPIAALETAEIAAFTAAVAGAVAENAAAPLTIPTYDGSGAVVHPDALDFGVGGSPYGTRYVMVFTPYPNKNNDYENPSIVVSDDKATWTVPTGLTNPIEAFPGGELFNNDPDLVDDNGTLYLFFRVNTAVDELVYYKTSADGLTWTDKVQLFSGYTAKSPAFIRTDDGWELFDGSGAHKSTSALGEAWANALPALPQIPGTLSHIDAIKEQDNYYVIAHRTDGTLVFLAYLVGQYAAGAWYMKEDALPADAENWASEFYRASIVRTATGFDLYYTGIPAADPNNWRIGLTHIPFSLP